MLGYITERFRQIKAINIFYERTLDQDEPQVAVYKEANIPRAMLTQPFVFVLYIGILPDLQSDDFSNYDENQPGYVLTTVSFMLMKSHM